MKKIIYILSVLILLICCTGCEKKKTEQEETLTICVKADFADVVQDVLDLWETLNEGVQGKLEIIPENYDAAQIKLSNIQTQILSGKGPDIFFLSTIEPGLPERTPTPFVNPEKAMYADVFLPLDSFFEQTEYSNPENWNQKILQAGKSDEGQMVLPLTYHYQQSAFRKADLKNVNNIPTSWDQLRRCEESVINKSMSHQAYSFLPLFGKIADYREKRILFSENELQRWAQEATEYILTSEKIEKDVVDNVFQNIWADPNFYDNLASAQEEMIICGFPNIDGGVTAVIDLYVAVNKNTKLRKEVFRFLDLLFSDEILLGSGIKVDEKWYGNTFNYRISDRRLIDNRWLSIRYPNLSEEDLMSLKESDEQISAVCFYSDLEKELYEMFQLYMKSYFQNEDNDVREKIVSKTYETLNMKVLE